MCGGRNDGVRIDRERLSLYTDLVVFFGGVGTFTAKLEQLTRVRRHRR